MVVYLLCTRYSIYSACSVMYASDDHSDPTSCHLNLNRLHRIIIKREERLVYIAAESTYLRA